MTQPAPSHPSCYGPEALYAQGLSVRYGEHLALEDASAAFRLGELSTIIGPNGAGKSTLLKALLGLVPLSSGRVDYAGGQALAPHAAYVPQVQTLDWGFPVTVQDLAMMGRTGWLGWWRRPGAADRARVEQALRQTDLWELRGRHIADLSGGQRQRALLARMLVRDAAVLLLDEPLTGVDAVSAASILALLREQADMGRAVIMVTHDLAQAAMSCDQMILVSRRIVAAGPPAAVYTPQNIAAAFGGSPAGGWGAAPA